MIKKMWLLVVIPMLALVALPLLAQEAPTAPTAQENVKEATLPAPTTEATESDANCSQDNSPEAPNVEQNLFVQNVAQAAFCNVSGFVECEATNGKACSSSGTSQRCYLAGYCEWGRCVCKEGSWHCYY